MKPNAFKFTVETPTPSLELLLVGVGIKASNMQTREAVSALVRGYGFDVHVGGCHVAIMQKGSRLAIITNKELPDFN